MLRAGKAPNEGQKCKSQDVRHLILGACLPIVYVPVHIVMGMPMTVGMRMRMAITMGIKNT